MRAGILLFVEAVFNVIINTNLDNIFKIIFLIFSLRMLSQISLNNI